MITKIKKTLLVLLTLMFATSIFSLTATAVASATLSFSSSKPTVGQSVTVKVTINGGEPIYNTTFDLTYDSNVLEYVNADITTTGGAGVVKASPNPEGASKATYSFNFKTISAGTSRISVSGGAYGVENDLSFAASANMIVSDVTKSDNANLKSLSLSKGTLSPKFSASKTSYTATVAKSVTEVKIYATAQDSGAKVAISGESALKEGKNTRTVTVTAPSGAQKTYTITITRSEEDTASSEPDQSSEPEVNPYETTLDGTTYTVLNDISGITLPTGFSSEKAEYNGSEVDVAKDKDNNYTLYYLKSAGGGNPEPYVLSENSNTFERLQYAVFGDKTYIFAEIPGDETAPDGYYETAVKIGEFSVKAFAANDTELTDFYYVYCFYENGFRMYRYDSRENVIQRSPEFKLTAVGAEKLPDSAGLSQRFASLSANAKVIVIGLLIAAVGAVALIVLLILKLISSRKMPYDSDEEEDVMFKPTFDEVSDESGNVYSEEKSKDDKNNRQ